MSTYLNFVYNTFTRFIGSPIFDYVILPIIAICVLIAVIEIIKEIIHV